MYGGLPCAINWLESKLRSVEAKHISENEKIKANKPPPYFSDSRELLPENKNSK